MQFQVGWNKDDHSLHSFMERAWKTSQESLFEVWPGFFFSRRQRSCNWDELSSRWMMGGKILHIDLWQSNSGCWWFKVWPYPVLTGKCRMNSGFTWSVVTRPVSFYQLDVVSAVEALPEGALVRISSHCPRLHRKHPSIAEPGHHLV